MDALMYLLNYSLAISLDLFFGGLYIRGMDSIVIIYK